MAAVSRTVDDCMIQKLSAQKTIDTDGINDFVNAVVGTGSVMDIVKMIIAGGAAAVVIVMLICALQSLFGYILFRYEMALIGAAGFGIATYFAGNYLLNWEGAKLFFATAFAVIMGAGMLFCVSAMLVFIFTAGTVVAVLFFASVANGWNMVPTIILVIAVSAALICALLYQHVIILSSAALSSALFGALLSQLFESMVFGYVSGGILFVLGVVLQYFMYIRKGRRERQKQKKTEADYIASQSKVVEDDVPGVPKVESTDFTDIFPTQQEVERRIEQQQRARRTSSSLTPEEARRRARENASVQIKSSTQTRTYDDRR